MSVIRNLLLLHIGIPPVGNFKLVPSVLSFADTGGEKTLNVEAGEDDSWTLTVEDGLPIEGFEVTPTELIFLAGGESKTVTVASEESWTI